MTLQATKYIGEIGRGRTNPKLIKCNDGNIYVVKFMNAEFKRSIINEWMAYQLGKLINFPMPDCEIISIPDALIPSTESLKTGVLPGLAFGSFFKKNISVNDLSLAYCKNINNLADMLIFDMWIHNRDRNKNNMIIVNDPQPRLLFIDHDKAFCGRIWEDCDLIKYSKNINPKWSKNQIYFMKHLKNIDLFQNTLQLIQSLTIAQIREAVYSIPGEWNLKESEQEYLIDFLLQRRELLGEQIQQIKKTYF